MKILKILSFIFHHPMSSGNFWSTIGRFLRWQLISRLAPGKVELPFVENLKLLTSRGMYGATGNYYCGLHEFQEMAFVLHFLRENDLFIDAGANIGSYTLLAAGACRAKVKCFEPVPEVYKNLETNICINDLCDSVETFNIGLSDCSDILKFTANLDTVNHVALDGQEGKLCEIEVRPLDSFIHSDSDQCTLLKIDVEGFELPVLKGAIKLLSSPNLKGVIVETIGSGEKYGYQESEIIELLESNGFSLYSYDVYAKRLCESLITRGNSLFIKDRSYVEKRLQTSRTYHTVSGSI